MDNPFFTVFNWFSVIDRLSKYIEQTSQSLLTYRHFDTSSGSGNFHSLLQTFTGSQHDTTCNVVTYMLGYFHDAAFSAIVYFQGIFDKWKFFSTIKFYVYDRSHDLYDSSFCHITAAHFLFYYFVVIICSVYSSAICELCILLPFLRIGSADDLCQFLCDVCLTDTVISNI